MMKIWNFMWAKYHIINLRLRNKSQTWFQLIREKIHIVYVMFEALNVPGNTSKLHRKLPFRLVSSTKISKKHLVKTPNDAKKL